MLHSVKNGSLGQLRVIQAAHRPASSGASLSRAHIVLKQHLPVELAIFAPTYLCMSAWFIMLFFVGLFLQVLPETKEISDAGLLSIPGYFPLDKSTLPGGTPALCMLQQLKFTFQLTADCIPVL